jgi:hypothetical protein
VGLTNILHNAGKGVHQVSRRKSDGNETGAEATVLRALHLAARRSSPHKASTRASMARAISVIEASMLGLTLIEELINECESLCQSGLETDDAEKHSLLAARYESVLVEINAIAEGCGHAGAHLLGEKGSVLEVELGEPRNFTLKLPTINLTVGARGLALPEPNRAFADASALAQFERHIGLVKMRLEKSASIFRDHAEDIAKRLAWVLEGSYAEAGETKPRGRNAF